MVLHHVADGADAVVEAASTLDTDRLAHRHLHAAHIVAVPHRLQQRVREPEHQQVLDALLAEVVVDAEDALLGEHRVQRFVELDRTGQITAEGLFHDDAPALVETDGRERLGDGRKHRRRNGHVKDGDRALVLVERVVQALPCLMIRVVTLDQGEPAHQRLDHARIHVGYRGDDRVVTVLAERLVRPVAPGDSDHGNLQRAMSLEVIQRRKQFSFGEVAGCAEQHQGVGGWLRGNTHLSWPVPSTWPPNCARRADKILFAVFERPRESKRPDNPALRIGAGTPSSIAAWAVQRPSPLSLTTPWKPSRCGSAAKAAAVRSRSQLDTTLPLRHTSVIAPRSNSYW